MEFDINKVYTAVNAEELPIGSRCIFADTIGELKNAVEGNGNIETLAHVYSEYEQYRFSVTKPNSDIHSLAYLVVPPKQAKKQKESEYKPFSSIEKAMEVIKKHGGWVKQKEIEHYYLVFGFRSDAAGLWALMEYGVCNFKELFDSFVFADDGSHCGELVEE